MKWLFKIMIQFIQGTAYFNSKHGCQKCTTIGTYFPNVRRTCFPQFDAPLRTDQSFREREDALHHKEDSPLEDLQSSDGIPRLDMIRDFSVSDPLHLLHQGIMKYCIRIWSDGTPIYKSKWSVDDKNKIDMMIQQCNKNLSSDVNRQVRSLKFVKYFKATEFRTILLYTGLVIFKSILPEHIYKHFLRLCLAVRLISCRTYVQNDNLKRLARVMLLEYFKEFINYYGSESIVSNIHNVIHIMDDVDHLGSLTENSTYPFENYLREMKLRTQASSMPIQQITRRIIELSFDSDNKSLHSKYIHPELKKWTPELKYEIVESKKMSQKFKFIRISPNVFISTRKIGDSWFITLDKKIVQMKYAFVKGNSFFVCGNELKYKTNYFTEPYSSHFTDVYLCNQEKNENSVHRIESIKSKMMCIPTENQYVLIPILHSIDECIENN